MPQHHDAEAFVDYVITRDATKISPMRGRYVILCNQYGGVLNDPILLRISKDEFWFSLSDSDIGLYLQGVNHDLHPVNTNQYLSQIMKTKTRPLKFLKE